MSDKKISQLTAAATPLAGTEVLPIVQSGSTVKVAVSDLTAGRSISASDITDTSLTASSAVATDASKKLVSVTNTGTGNNVLATSPTITTPVINGFTGDTSIVNVGSGQFYKDTSGNIGLNTTTPNPLSGPFTPYLTVKGVSYDGVIQTLGSRGDGDNTGAGQFNFLQNANTTNKIIAQVTAETEGSTANNRGGRLMFFTKADAAASTTEQMRISSTGNVTLYTGNLVIGTSGKGIDFSATASGSGTMTSELLNDYEEGTFTPTIIFGAGSTGITYGTQTGKYTKVGNLVTVSFLIFLSSKGSSTGQIKIGNLPYSAAAGTGVFPGNSIMLLNGNSFPASVWGRVDPGSVSIDLYYQTTTSASSIQDSSANNDFGCQGSISYFV